MKEIHDPSIQSAFAQSTDLAEKLSRETYVLAAGITGGAVKEAVNHPLETVGETAAMALAATGLTAVVAAEIPIISAAALGTGALLTGKYIWDLADPNSLHNVERNRAFGSALSDAWSGNNVDGAVHNLQDKAGRDALMLCEGLIAGGTAAKFSARIPVELAGVAPMKLAGEYGLEGPGVFNQGKPLTFEEYINFQRKGGEIRKLTWEQYVRDLAVKAQEEKSRLQQEAKVVEVNDSKATVHAKDPNTGELIETSLPEPNGPEGFEPGTIRPSYFNND